MKRFLTALVLIFAAASALAAKTWDAAADFPGGQWSYGWRMPNTDTFYPMQLRRDGTCGGGKLSGLQCYSKWANAAWPLPQIGINTTGATINYSTGISHMIIPVAALNMRPDIDGGMPVLRWTAPDDATYIVHGSAQVIDHSTLGAVVHITGLKSKRLDAVFGDAYQFMLRREMLRGDTIDFAVEAVEAVNGDYFFASTELRVSVLKVD